MKFDEDSLESEPMKSFPAYLLAEDPVNRQLQGSASNPHIDAARRSKTMKLPKKLPCAMPILFSRLHDRLCRVYVSWSSQLSFKSLLSYQEEKDDREATGGLYYDIFNALNIVFMIVRSLNLRPKKIN